MKKIFYVIIFIVSLISNLNSQAQQITAVRTVLGSGLPAGAQGYSLNIFRVTFPPGARVPGEIHSGMQVVYIVSGELTVKILGGEAEIRRAMPDGTQSPVVIIKAGPTEYVLKAGDTFLEPETLILSPRNAGKIPLVILTSTLIPVGKPQSIPITEPIKF